MALSPSQRKNLARRRRRLDEARELAKSLDDERVALTKEIDARSAATIRTCQQWERADAYAAGQRFMRAHGQRKRGLEPKGVAARAAGYSFPLAAAALNAKCDGSIVNAPGVHEHVHDATSASREIAEVMGLERTLVALDTKSANTQKLIEHLEAADERARRRRQNPDHAEAEEERQREIAAAARDDVTRGRTDGTCSRKLHGLRCVVVIARKRDRAGVVSALKAIGDRVVAFLEPSELSIEKVKTALQPREDKPPIASCIVVASKLGEKQWEQVVAVGVPVVSLVRDSVAA